MTGRVCCFSGHRYISASEREQLERLLDIQIEKIAQCSAKTFICGGALGFDTLAARAVIRARRQDGDIRLILAVPYRGMEKRWSEADRADFDDILAEADGVRYMAEEYDRDCMLRRNRYMVEHSDICICYMTRHTGGTAYTVAQALKKGIEVINLAMEMDG